MTATLVWQNKNMKDRFWAFYYWAMISYLGLALFIMVISPMTWNDSLIKNTSPFCDSSYAMRTNERCSDGADTPDFIISANDILFFKFIDFQTNSCRNIVTWELLSSCEEQGINVQRNTEVQNYYPFLLFFILTFTRWIVIGKHFWQRP